VSVHQLTHRQAEERDGATDFEMHTQERGLLRGVDHEEPVVGSGDDGPREALADTRPDEEPECDGDALGGLHPGHLERSIGGGVVETSPAEQPSPAQHRIERRAQFVGEHGEEPVLGLGFGGKPR
jgi:hypothetical protein